MEFSVLSTLLFAGGMILLFVVGMFMLTVYEAAVEARAYYRRKNTELDRQASRESVPQP